LWGLDSSDDIFSTIFEYRSLESLTLSSEATVLNVPDVVAESVRFWWSWVW
jgi:hypothetical protein